MTRNTELQADYLVVGSGAMGMAFTDTLLSETDATFVMVDRHHRPGGHWNDAYPFVRLHQPSAFYGVNSEPLGHDVIDRVGWNEGLYELASGAEVCAYFDHVMQRRFLPSGRVRYFPSCEYQGEGRFTGTPSAREYRVNARKIVDATYMNVTVPSVTPPAYAVDEGVRCVPLNELPREPRPAAGWCVIGAGKTGMDACLWLLAQDVDPDDITWVMPRDSWMLDRANIQPGELRSRTAEGFGRQMEAIAEAKTVEGLLDAVHACGQLLRLDDTVRPTMYRCATVTGAELEQLRRIRNVVRKGRIARLTPDAIHFEDGQKQASDPATLFVDCSADGLAQRPAVPVFQGDHLTLQAVRTCQQVFSAAFIGHVEATLDDEARKNELCTPVPHPNTDLDFLRTTLASTLNQARWAMDPELAGWLSRARLDFFGGPDAAEPTAEDQARQARFAETGLRAVANLERLLAEVDDAA